MIMAHCDHRNVDMQREMVQDMIRRYGLQE